MKRLLLILSIVLLLFSCSTKIVVREGQPEWTYEEESVQGKRVFVSFGSANNSDGARDAAYNALLNDISRDVGLDLSVYLRELIQSDKVDEISLSIDNYFLYDRDNIHEVWIRGLIDESAYEALRNEGVVAINERESQIEDLLGSALLAYQENRDGEAVDYVLRAVSVSLDGPIRNADYQKESLLSRAMEYVDNLSLELVRPSSEKMETRVRAKRRKGIFYPPAENLFVEATFAMENDDGSLVDTTFICRTNEEGEFLFNRTNPYMVREGSVKFSIYVDPTLIAQIEEKAGEEFIEPLLDLIEEKTILYTYRDSGSLDLSDVIIALSEYDEDGNSINSGVLLNEFRSYLERVNITGEKYVYIAGEEEDILDTLQSDWPDKSYYIIGRIGLVEDYEGVNISYVMTQGSLSIYRNGEEEASVRQESYTSGHGKSLSEARTVALSNQARILTGLLLEKI